MSGVPAPSCGDPLLSESLQFTAGQLEAIGISRIAEITHLDTLRVPVFSATRPGSYMPDGQSITAFKGKGFTREMARTGAIMEAAERHAADPRTSPLPRRLASLHSLKTAGEPAVSPNELIRPRWWPPYRNQRIEWVRGRDLFDGGDVWVPLASVLMPYKAPPEVRYQSFWGSHGLASSWSHETAVAAGLLELIERYSLGKAFNANRAQRVRFEGELPERLRWLLERFASAGLNLVVKEVTSPDLGVPAFFAACDDPHTRNNYLVTRGHAANWDPATAITRAILEAAQSRAGLIQGAREDVSINPDLAKWRYEDLIRVAFGFFFTNECETVSFDSYRARGFPLIRSATDFLLGRVRAAGFDRAIAFDLTRAEVGVPVARVVVPGLFERLGDL